MIFEKVDKDRSGSIDHKEFKALMRELGYELSFVEQESLLKQLDSNGSGRIEFNELLMHIAKGQEMKDN